MLNVVNRNITTRTVSIFTPIIAATTVNFITLPLIYHSLTKIEAGFWFLLIDFSTIALSLDLGISNFQIRAMSKVAEERNILSIVFLSGFRAIRLISLVFFLFGSVILFAYILINKTIEPSLYYSVLCFISSIAASIYSYSFLGILRVRDKFEYIALSSIISNVAYLLIILVFFRTNEKFLLFSIAFLIRTIINSVCFKIYSRKLYDRDITPDRFSYNRESFSFFINTVVLYLYLTVESLLMSLFYSPAIIALYIAHRKIFDFTKSGVDAYLISTFPKMSRKFSSNSNKEVFIYSVCLATFYFSMLVISIPVLRILTGSKYDITFSLLLVICIQFIFSGLSAYLRQRNLANNLTRLALNAAISELVIKVSVILIFISSLKYYSIPLGSILASSVSILISSKAKLEGGK